MEFNIYEILNICVACITAGQPVTRDVDREVDIGNLGLMLI